MVALSPSTEMIAPSGMRRVGVDVRGHTWDAEFATDDDRVTQGRAHIAHYGGGRDEQRRPRRIGAGRHQDVSRLEGKRITGVEDHPRSPGGIAGAVGAAGDAGDDVADGQGHDRARPSDRPVDLGTRSTIENEGWLERHQPGAVSQSPWNDRRDVRAVPA